MVKRKKEVSDTTSSSSSIGDGVTKSPLDTHGYKIVKLANNGVKGILVSTCIHPHESGIKRKRGQSFGNCTFDKIFEFNETHLNLKTRSSLNDAEKDPEDEKYIFFKATKKQGNESEAKRAKANARKNKPATKCTKGVHEDDDKMQSFCNKKCVGVLYVKAGFFQDPLDVPGMAHFCEHAISLGSKKYPETEAFSKFVAENGGMYNAMTEEECTIYYFYVDYKDIEEALDIFVDMFANPIFNSSDVQKEINNINSEFEIKKLYDILRHSAILQSCIPKDHPANNFGFGTKKTLSDKEIMSKLKRWIASYYVGENMIFALQGPLTVPRLQKLLEKYMSKLPVKSSASIITRSLPTSYRPKKLPFEMKKWNQLYFMDILENTSFMTITWPLDAKFGRDYATKPIHYFSYIFTHKGKLSLDRYLKEKGWIVSLMVNAPDSNSFCTEYYTLFTVYMELTAEGLAQRMNILKTVLLYVKLLQQSQVKDVEASKRIYTEIQQLEADIFHYRSDLNLNDPTFGRKFNDRDANTTLWTLCHTLSKTENPEQVILAAFLLQKFDSKVLNDFVKCLTPSNAMVVFADKSFAEHATDQDEWYEVKYFAKPMPNQLIDEINKASGITRPAFPQPNPFVALSFCNVEKEGKIEKRDNLLAYTSDKGHLTYGNTKCRKGQLPSAQYIMDFLSPALEDDTDLINTPCLGMLVSLLAYVLDIELGSALCSLISYDIETAAGFIRVILSGPSPKLPELAKHILATVENLDQHVNLYQSIFADLKRIQIDLYKSLMNDLDTCAREIIHYVLSLRSHFLTDFIRILEESIDQEDFSLFVKQFNRRMFLSGDLYGCVSKTHATHVAQHVDKFKCTPYRKPYEQEVDKTIELPLGERCLRVWAKSKDNGNVVVLNYYQVGEVTKTEKRILTVISSCLGETAFDELRSKENLGYHAEASLYVLNGIYGVAVLVQGAADSHTCGYIDECMDKFLTSSYVDFLSTRSHFVKNMQPWMAREGELNYKDTKEFYTTHLLPTGNRFRKISIQMQGYREKKSRPKEPSHVHKKVDRYRSGVKLQQQQCACNERKQTCGCGLSRYSNYLKLCREEVNEHNGYFITDVQGFKNSRPCFPNLENTDFVDEE